MEEKFKKISWYEMALPANRDLDYYIKGQSMTLIHYYGPYKLHSADTKSMKNAKGNIFMHYAEDFYILKEQKPVKPIEDHVWEYYLPTDTLKILERGIEILKENNVEIYIDLSKEDRIKYRKIIWILTNQIDESYTVGKEYKYLTRTKIKMP